MHPRNPQKEAGQFLILVAVSLLVLIGFVGLAIDSGRGYGVKAKLNAAVDAASIAAARALAEGSDDASRIDAATAAAKKYYSANFPTGYLGATLEPLTTKDIDAKHDSTGYWKVVVTGAADMPVTFMRIFGLGDVNVTATGTTIRRDLDIILVLDTSGSIGGALPALKSAAINYFVNKFNTSYDRLGFVIFASGAVLNPSIVTDGSRGFNKTNVVNAINSVSTASGATASAEALRQALNNLNKVPKVNRSSLRVIVFFSDGAPNQVTGKFLDGSSTTVPGLSDLYSDTSGSETGKATMVFQSNARDRQLGTYYNIAALPNTSAGFPLTDDSGNPVGDIPLDGYNNKRSLTGTPIDNTRCNVNKAARNMAENVANIARSQGIMIHAVSLGAAVNTLEPAFTPNNCSYSSTNELGSTILKRIANANGSDTYNPAQPTGLYVWAANSSDLDSAFATIVSEMIRLSM